MKFIIDFFPILLFFGAYKMADIYTATAVLMAATVVQTALIYKMDGKLQTMHKITLVLVLGFGALTLGLHDERFIKWKPTLLYAGRRARTAEEKLFVHVVRPTTATALGCVAPLERGLDVVLRFHGRHQRLCGALLQHRRLGQLQALGLCFPGGVHLGPRPVHRQIFAQRRG